MTDNVRTKMKAQQQRWMSERQAAADVASVRRSSAPPLSRSASKENVPKEHLNPGPPSSSSSIDDNMLNKLTEKISSRLRTEIVQDLRKSTALTQSDNITITTHIEEYMNTELSNHCCQICFEIMMPPTRTPTLLFPCGHTFCAVCVASHKSKSGGTSARCCPYCRGKIEHVAENVSLKQLIERFGEKRRVFEEGKADHVDEVFPDSRGGEEKQGGDNGGTRYESEYITKSMRYKILKNQLMDEEEGLSQIVKRKVGVMKTMGVLKGEKEGVVSKIRRLDEELELIESYEKEQIKKLDECGREERESVGQVEMVRETLHGLEGELEKMKLLVEGSGGRVEDEDCHDSGFLRK